MKSYNIKQKVKVFVLIIGTAVLAGCTNLDETIYSSYTDENFPSSPVCINDWTDLCGSSEVI